MDTLTMQIKI